ncbi:MAG: choice-of-anchor J domain-containing protein [Muribaculaceae bacterium]|nr:choice-of-anchor J domain-containing protein [Muribaculaceae bacterium]
MKQVYKTFTGYAAAVAAICAGFLGISGANLSPDFIKRGSSKKTVEEILNRHKVSHRVKGVQTRAKKASVSKASSELSQRFQCVLTYSDNWEDSGDEPGVYTFDTTLPIKFSQAFVSDDYTPSGGAFFTDKYYILTTISEDWFTGEVDIYSYKYSRGDWEELSYASQSVYALYNAICYDPIDDLAYGFFYSDNGGDWGYMDLNSMEVTHVAPLEAELIAVAINELGEAYGIGADGVFYGIDKKTGAMSTIGKTGLSPEYMQSAAFGTDGNLYWAASEAYSSGLYTIDVKTGKATEIGSFNGTEEVCALYALNPTPASGAPAPATSLKADVSGNELAFPFSFMIPAKTAGGSSLTGEVEYEVKVDGISVASGKGTAGSKVELSLTVEHPGYHLFKVTLTNGEGGSEPATVRSWIGVDEPKAVRNASVEKVSDNSIKITWDAPDGGVNGGFFNADMIRYDVTRLPEKKVVAENLTSTTFTDEIDIKEGQSLIRYIITPCVEGLEGEGSITDGIVIGKPYQTPVEFTFDTEEDYNIFTVIDNNETVTLDSGLWQYTPSGEAAGYLGGTKDGDDWLMTPSVYLKARTNYAFSHDVLCYSDNWPEEYSVYLGTSPEIAGMKTEIVPKTTIWWDEYRTKTVTITVPEDGVYYFGFHATSEAGSVFFLIDNISIKESNSLDAPAAVDDLKVEAGALGAKKATISFTAPVKNVEGKELVDDMTVKICRDGVEIKAYSDVAPGEAMEYEDADANDGKMNSYEVFCSNSYGAGPAESSEVWVGLDAPSAPVDAKVSLNADGNPVISWSKPEGGGVHGGYVDNSDLNYTVAMLRNGALVPVVEKTDAFTCTDTNTVLENTGDQVMNQYYIVPASNQTGEYGNNATALYISGKPYPLPFKESFANRKPTNFWALTGTDGEGWVIGDDFSIGSQDDDNGVLTYLPAVPEVTATAMSGKISLSGAKNPQLTFYLRKMSVADNGFYDTDPSKDVLNIKVGVDGFNMETISSIRLEDIKKVGDYLYQAVSLKDIDAREFVVIAFEYEAVSTRTPIMIDNIAVKDVCDYNAVAGEVTAPEAVEVFDDLIVNVNVINGGNNPLSNIKVRLMRGEKEEAESTVESLDPDQTVVVKLEAEATPEWGEEAEFTVTVDAENDEVEGDNTSDSFKVKVAYHSRPAVSDLEGVVKDDELKLSWSEPAGLTALETRVTETFDSYNHGDLSFGEWKSEDKSFWGFEGVKTITVDGVKIEIPNSDDAQAFMVFDPALAGIDLDDNPEWEPISGDKLIVSFGDAANDDMEANNDWLISPELSGKEQTITFWARTAAKKGKPDDIRILTATEIEYNNNGTVKSSCFEALEGGDITLTREWVKYEFTLPAGTKYFAIRNISEDGFAVLIDDITYELYLEKANAVLEGYNVYRDSSLLTPAPTSVTSFTVSPVVDGDYMVKAVYDEGESEASNVVTITGSGINEISSHLDSDTLYDLNGYKVKQTEKGRIYVRRNKKVMTH